MFKRIALIQVLSNGAFLACFTYISIYADEAGLSKFEIALMASLYAVATFFSAYIFGRMADNYGRRRILLIGLDLLIVLAALQALAWSLPSFFTFRFIAGVGFGMFPAALAAYAFEARSKMGKFSSFGALGWGLSLLASGVVAETFGVYSVFLFSSALVIISLLVAFTLKPIKQVRIKTPLMPFRMIMKNHGILFPFILRHSSAAAIWVLWPLFLKETIGLTLWEIGIVQATNAFTQFFAMYFMGDRMRPKTQIGLGILLSAVAFISFTVIQTFPLFLVTQVLLGLSWACLFVGTLRTMLDRNRERATAAGLLNSSISFSALLGPFISIMIVQIFPGSSYEAPMYLAFGASLLAFLLFLERNRRRAEVEEIA
ncbi:MAG: MFS transporter [Thermoplasmatota archaeon]